MARRPRTGFRFDPPPVATTAAIDWTLARAFGPPPTGPETIPEAGAAFEIAARLGLAPRIAARLGRATLESEIGAALAGRFAAARAAVLALELAEDRALDRVAEAARELHSPFALLKGGALSRSGRSPAGGRPGSDLDLLVPERALRPLQRGLERRGLAPAGGRAWEHQAPVLRAPEGAAVELHRSLPGVRLSGRRSARYEDIERAGWLEPWIGDGAPAAEGRFPKAEVLLAHALVHALAQHGLSAGYPGFWLIADLMDLGATAGEEGGRWAEPLSWIEGDVSRCEARAAFEIARALSSEGSRIGDLSGWERRLADHFLARALDRDYARELRARQFEAPISDLPLTLARARALLQALRPPPEAAPDGAREPLWRYGRRLLARPWELGRRWFAARSLRRSRDRSAGAAPEGP